MITFEQSLVRRAARDGVHEVTITTNGTKRDGNQIVASGGKFENYLRNPVVLFGHWGIPVARTLSLSVEADAVVATFEFPAVGVSERADEVRRLWEAGFLNAASVGILPEKWENLETDKDSWFPPRKFTEWELVEWSIVPVPADGAALRRALSLFGSDDGGEEARQALAVVRSLKEMWR
jgi:phage head maturation protease